jgi:hypothetical protein
MYWCWLNFPRCNVPRDITLATCVSACENYFISCGFDKSIWRCGPSKFFNGYEPEVPTIDIYGEPHYLRDYFPGQPFRQNAFNKEGLNRAICTPAIDGSAIKSYASGIFKLLLSMLLVLSVTLLM